MVLTKTTASTWAQRNPTRSRLHGRHHHARHLNNAARQLLCKQTKMRHTALLTDLKQLNDNRDQGLEELAAKHSRKVPYLKKLMNTSSVFKPTRKPNLMNAIIHYKAQQLNEDLAPGQRRKMQDIRDAVKQDPDLDPNSMNDDKKRELLENLLKHRSVQSHGVRVSNLAAAQDIAHTVQRIEQEMSSLSDRTGNYGFAFFTRGHLDDTAIPEWIATPGVERFLVDILKTQPDDIMRAFEHWGVLQGKNGDERDTNASLRAEITKLVSTGLHAITGRKAIVMSYANHDVDIRHRYQVEITNWPAHIPFTSPSHISTSAALRAVRDALKSGLCRWIPLTKESKDALAKRIENGELAKKPRAARADKGTKRGPRGKENIPPSEQPRRRRTATKAATVAKTTLPPRSAAIIDDDEDDETA